MLTYTNEMSEQDRLWKIENEDLETMELFFEDIMAEAKILGFTGVYRIVDGSNEKVIEVFKSVEDREKAFDGQLEDTEYGQFGYCRPLINYVDELLSD